MERIYSNEKLEDNWFFVDGYKINPKQPTVFYGDIGTHLTQNEFKLLLYLVKNKNDVLTREQILEKVWGFNYFGSGRAVDNTIRRLRNKMKNLNIYTAYGYGYKLVVK